MIDCVTVQGDSAVFNGLNVMNTLDGYSGAVPVDKHKDNVMTKTCDSFQAKGTIEMDALDGLKGFDHFDDDDLNAKEPSIHDLEYQYICVPLLHWSVTHSLYPLMSQMISGSVSFLIPLSIEIALFSFHDEPDQNVSRF